MKTTREFQLALSKLLDQVRFENKWTMPTFQKVANTVGISKSEAYRFYKALSELKLLTFDKQRRTMISHFNVVIWKNEDSKLMLIKEIMEMFPNLQQTRGRVKGKKYPKTVKQISQVSVNPLDKFTAQELVAELRSRGYEVKATKTITTVEEL